MAYGQTGAGKTYTMLGDERIYSNRGVSPRSISAVFAEISSRPETDFSVQVSYLEIYNDRIYDLLLPPGTLPQSEYAIAENKRDGIVVRGLTMQAVGSEEVALHALFSGQGNRTTAQHQLNSRSNRSHCIFTMHVSQRSRLGAEARTLHSKLHLVDLAGSERIKKTMASTGGGATDETLSRESKFINKSLSHLEQCIVALTAPSRAHVPYRSAKLTNLLKDSLGGNCSTVLIACAWGEASHLEETLSTLKLAQRMMRVTNTTAENVTVDPALLAKRQERQIAQLQQELLS
jgi:kinesin family protein 6/9